MSAKATHPAGMSFEERREVRRAGAPDLQAAATIFDAACTLIEQASRILGEAAYDHQADQAFRARDTVGARASEARATIGRLKQAALAGQEEPG